MFDHIGLHVKDLDASARFYAAILAPLGYVECSRDKTSAGFGPKGAAAFWLYVSEKAPRSVVHVAFSAKNHDGVAKFYEQGLRAGGSDHGKPGIRADYAANYFAAFLLDPDGNNVEAVCMAGKS